METLSDKDCGNSTLKAIDPSAMIFRGEDVKEFIRKLKEAVNTYYNRSIYRIGMLDEIDKLAGKKLT